MNQKSGNDDGKHHLRSNLSTDFFEVSINSQKLNEMFVKLNTIATQQDLKIFQLNQNLNEVAKSLEEKIEKETHKNGMLYNKLDNKINDNFKKITLSMTQVAEKIEAKNRKIENDVQNLRSKIGRVEDYTKQDLQRGLTQLKKQIIGKIPMQQKDEQKQHCFDFCYLINKMKQKSQEMEKNMMKLFRQMYEAKQQQRKNNENEQLVRLALKKKQIEEDINTYIGNYKDLPINDIKYPTLKKQIGQKKQVNQVKDNRRPFRENTLRHVSMNQNQMPFFDSAFAHNLKEMNDTIAKLEKQNLHKNSELKEIRNKLIVLDEKIGIVTRKNQKYQNDYFQLKNCLKKVEDKKMDDKVIEELRNYIKWSIRDLQDQMSLKCSQQSLVKERAKNNEKIAIIHQNLIEKADKGEIMKAIFFLQEKMKEIIFLIAAEHTDERDGAIMKTNIKCLSCDKQMQKTQKSTQNKINIHNDHPYMKPITHRVRKRYRDQLRQNYTAGNEEDGI